MLSPCRLVRITALGIALAGPVRATSAAPPAASQQAPAMTIDRIRRAVPRPPVKIAMHRGANRYAPENTWPAVEQALTLAADFVEIDIHTSADGRHVLLHDRNLDRTTSGHGPVNQRSLAEILQLDAGSWFAPQFAGTRVPVLEELIEQTLAWEQQTASQRPADAEAPDLKPIHFYLDAKAIAPEALASVIAKYGLEQRSIVFQGPGYLAKLRAANPGVRLMPPLYAAPALDRLADDLQPFAVDVRWEALSRDLIERCHARGILVFSDAIGDHEREEDYLQAIDWGIDVIQTDEPLRVWRAIETWGRRGE